MAYGISATGFTRKTTAQIIADIQARLRSSISPELNFSAYNPLQQIIAACAVEAGSLWELAEQCYHAMNPEVAYGLLLDNIGSYIGAPRLEARPATGTLLCSGVAGTIIPVDSVVATEVEGTRIVTTEEGEIGVGGTVSIAAETEDAGDFEIATATDCDIITPITGWSACEVDEAILNGQDIESDAAYRLRLEQAKEGVSAGTDNSIADAIIDAVSGIESCTVTSNRTDAEVDGLPAHSFEAVIWPDTVDQDDIAVAIWLTQPSGIQSYGSETKTVTDSEGYDQTINFSFATEVPVQFELNIEIDSDVYPSDGDYQIGLAIYNYMADIRVGQGVKNSAISNAVHDAVDGIDLISVELEGSIQSISIDRDEIATVQSISVNHV